MTLNKDRFVLDLRRLSFPIQYSTFQANVKRPQQAALTVCATGSFLDCKTEPLDFHRKMLRKKAAAVKGTDWFDEVVMFGKKS